MLRRSRISSLALVVIGLMNCAAVLALEAPSISVGAAGEGRVRVSFATEEPVEGFNVYLDSAYFGTYRPANGAAFFEFRGGTGDYCVASFATRDNQQVFSPCSAPARLQTTDPAPSTPGSLVATLYSSTVAELFWEASVDDAGVSSYRIVRDGELVNTRDGLSYFEPSLQADRVYQYEVIAVDADGNSSEPARISLNTGGKPGGATNNNSDAQPPSIPGNLRGTFYSDTAAEIFWDAAFDNVGVEEYDIYRDGTLLATRDGRSYFESSLSRNAKYRYEVIAIDFNGNRSQPAVFELGEGSELQSSNEFSIAIPGERYDLREGDTAGVFVPVSITRLDNNTREVRLSLSAENVQDEANLSYRFDPAVLPAGVSGSVLDVRLAIGMAPLDFHERRFVLSVTDGQSVQERRIIFNVKPVRAPDVYLLAGQSNMEGSSELFARNTSPGGPDELVALIRQLNVRQNSEEVFREPWQFTDEFSNVSEPRYITAEDPLHEPREPGRFSKEASFVGLGLSFAKAALQNTTQEIYLVPAAWSASGFCNTELGGKAWNAAPAESFLGGTLLADRAITRLNMTLRETRGIFRGILWHQGEADSNSANCANTYQRNLQRLVRRFRTEALVDSRGAVARGSNADVPLVVGSMSKGNDDRGNFASFSAEKMIVDSVHRNIESAIDFAAFSNHDDLVPPAFPCGDGSCIHFGAGAYREIGKRYHDALQRIINR